MLKGSLRNRLISENHASYDLSGKINPTFQNEGTDDVYIDGRKVLPGQSYSVNVPNVIMQNAIPITFEGGIGKTKILYIGFVELT